MQAGQSTERTQQTRLKSPHRPALLGSLACPEVRCCLGPRAQGD